MLILMRSGRSRKKKKARKGRHGTRKYGGTFPGWSDEDQGTLQFLNAVPDEKRLELMLEDFLTSPNWDEEKIEQYPAVNFGSRIIYELIQDPHYPTISTKFQSMANTVCAGDVDLHKMLPNLENNTSLRNQLAKYILNHGMCDQEFIWKRMKKPPVESPFEENLHQINVILDQYAIENFQDTDEMRKRQINLALTHLKDLEKSIGDRTMKDGDINAKLLDYLNYLILHLPIRKWQNNDKKYCSKVPLQQCDQDYKCKLKTNWLGRKKCGVKRESDIDVVPHLPIPES